MAHTGCRRHQPARQFSFAGAGLLLFPRPLREAARPRTAALQAHLVSLGPEASILGTSELRSRYRSPSASIHYSTQKNQACDFK